MKQDIRTLSAWAKVVRERAGSNCQRCGIPGERWRQYAGKVGQIRLEAHHILPIADHPEKIFDPDNGILLCVHCHKRIHVALHQERRIHAS